MVAAPGCSSVSVPELETVCLTGGEGPCTGAHPSGKELLGTGAT